MPRGPVLEDPAAAEQARDDALVEAADARRERDPVRAVDGRDRVELDRAEARDLAGGDVCARARALPGGEPSSRDVPPERRPTAAERRQARPFRLE